MFKVQNVDEPPVFSNTQLFVDENLPSGTLIENSRSLASDPEKDTVT